jgi:hypothetical protein
VCALNWLKVRGIVKAAPEWNEGEKVLGVPGGAASPAAPMGGITLRIGDERGGLGIAN